MRKNFKNIYTFKQVELQKMSTLTFNELRQESIKSGVIYPFTESVRQCDIVSSISVFQKSIIENKAIILLPNYKLENFPTRVPDVVIFDFNKHIKETLGCCHSNMNKFSPSYDRKTIDWKNKITQDEKIIKINRNFMQYKKDSVHTSIFQIYDLENFKRINNGENYNELISMETQNHKVQFVDKEIYCDRVLDNENIEIIDSYTRSKKNKDLIIDTLEFSLTISGKLTQKQIDNLLNKEKVDKRVYAWSWNKAFKWVKKGGYTKNDNENNNSDNGTDS